MIYEKERRELEVEFDVVKNKLLQAEQDVKTFTTQLVELQGQYKIIKKLEAKGTKAEEVAKMKEDIAK